MERLSTHQGMLLSSTYVWDSSLVLRRMYVGVRAHVDSMHERLDTRAPFAGFSESANVQDGAHRRTVPW